MIAWDSLGQAIRDATFWLEAGIEIRELEVATFRWMILKANKLCPTGIQYKTYYLNLYHCWRNKEDRGRQLFHGLVDDCRRLFVILIGISFSSPREVGNIAAHCLANLAFVYLD